MSNNREYADLGHALAMIKNGEMAHSTLEAAMAQCIESNLKEIALLNKRAERAKLYIEDVAPNSAIGALSGDYDND